MQALLANAKKKAAAKKVQIAQAKKPVVAAKTKVTLPKK